MPEMNFDFDALARRGVAMIRLDAGEKLFLEHDSGSCMYAVRSGGVDILTYGKVLERIGPNGFFGEMALIDDEGRSAAAIAFEETFLASIDKATFLDMVARDPDFALTIMRALAQRIRFLKSRLR